LKKQAEIVMVAGDTKRLDGRRGRGYLMSDNDHKINKALEGVDEGRRETLNRLITGTSFIVPIVASFAMDGLAISKAKASPSNGSGL
jgi:hypothetical protein